MLVERRPFRTHIIALNIALADEAFRRTELRILRGWVCQALDLGDGGAVKPERPVRVPFKNLHRADPPQVVGILSGEILGINEACRQEDVNSARAIRSRSGKQDTSSAMLIFEPLTMFWKMKPLVFFLARA